ncbi:MAG: outer membrane homotrimeric porin [Desulfovibrio sp.]|uniref:outer membrane homotrimeric porin n=1 Tax=Desulfovibrio sp. TaxID=885 RepID=UPI002A35BB63|nr:outer membrane homotrimeric porin [Desulfovibrio sp.]MDY0258959.1 outer membrane homotrimeric porin [Desulfovibrio sp.]
MQKKSRVLWCVMALALLLGMGVADKAQAIDFKARGIWSMGYGIGDPSLTEDVTTKGDKKKVNNDDKFVARQRVLLFLDAIASENLMGSVQFKLGPQDWGKARQGSALGADGTNIKLTQAYMQWAVPQTALKMKMGLQYFSMPNAAGGSAVFDTQAAAVVANYAFNSNVGLTALWMRPFNDNYSGGSYNGILSSDKANYLDNMDLFALTLPLTFDGIKITPWVMPGMLGRNANKFDGFWQNGLGDGYPAVTLYPYLNKMGGGHGLNVQKLGSTSKTYGNVFWAGIPFKITAIDPWNFELDLNYGYVEEMGRFDVLKRNDANDVVRGSSQRQGWLAKALAEYKLDWGVPGIFGWYASGDDGNVKNGSERMPSLCPYGSFTSFFGDGNMAWSPALNFMDKSLSYAGTWGIGAQIRDISFVEDLKHVVRVAYWGGTNSPSMVKYMDHANAWDSTSGLADGPYLTTNDGMLEVNLISSYKIYENLEMNVELGYVANYMDNSTWKKSYNDFGGYSKQDAWKAQVVFQYKF